MALALVVALPFLGILFPLLADRKGRSLCALAAALAPAAAMVVLWAEARHLRRAWPCGALSLADRAGAGSELSSRWPVFSLRAADFGHWPAGPVSYTHLTLPTTPYV